MRTEQNFNVRSIYNVMRDTASHGIYYDKALNMITNGYVAVKLSENDQFGIFGPLITERDLSVIKEKFEEEPMSNLTMQPLIYTGNNRFALRLFTYDQDHFIAAQEKFLRLLKSPENMVYKIGKEPHDGIHVFSGKDQIALIMPARFSNEKPGDMASFEMLSHNHLIKEKYLCNNCLIELKDYEWGGHVFRVCGKCGYCHSFEKI